jgi:hypothetical protein
MIDKIDRPLVKMVSSGSDNDLQWYSSMMGRQAQIITHLEEQLKIVKETNRVLSDGNDILLTHRSLLQKQINTLNSKVLIFNPQNIMKNK